MSERNSWLATTLLGQADQSQNFANKLPGYGEELGLKPEQVSAMVANANSVTIVIDATNASKATQKAMTAWRENCMYGEPQGNAAPPAPVFPVVEANLINIGSMKTFIDNRDLIVALPGYTDAIGNDLGLIGTASTRKPADETQPEFKSVTAMGHDVSLVGSMQGFTTMIVEYAKKGGAYRQIGTVTNLPAVISVTTDTPGQAETGQVRAYFVTKNARYGNNSSNYDVVLS